jgi:glycosyltransferase involved in cell wall biosynthesis
MQGISVIIPCHDEASAIPAVVAGVRATLAGREHEVLVVDDGSSDGTADAARQAGARVLRLEPNRGKGVALLAGAQAAAFPLLAFLDGDGQDDPADLVPLLERLTQGVDLVVGSRFLGRLHPGSIHPLNRVANQAFSALISLLFGERITDSQAGFRVLRREAFLALGVRAREYDVETDTLLKALKAGWRVVEAPVQRHPRRGSSTDFQRVRHGLLILWTILRARVTP